MDKVRRSYIRPPTGNSVRRCDDGMRAGRRRRWEAREGGRWESVLKADSQTPQGGTAACQSDEDKQSSGSCQRARQPGPQITSTDQEVRVLLWPRLEAKPSTLSDTGEKCSPSFHRLVATQPSRLEATQTALKRSAKPMQGGRVAET